MRETTRLLTWQPVAWLIVLLVLAGVLFYFLYLRPQMTIETPRTPSPTVVTATPVPTATPRPAPTATPTALPPAPTPTVIPPTPTVELLSPTPVSSPVATQPAPPTATPH